MLNKIPKTYLKNEGVYDKFIIPIDKRLNDMFTDDFKKVNSSIDSRRTFFEKYGVKYENIIAWGISTDISEDFCCNHLDVTAHSGRESANKPPIYKSGMCYSSKIKNDAVPLHWDGKSSWKCLLNTLRNPTHVLIFKHLIPSAQ